MLALGTAATWSASAKASDQPTAAQAASFYQQGNVEFEKKNWPAAEAAYLKAWEIARTFDVAANLGEVEFHLGKMRETAEYLSYSLRTAPPSSKPAQRERTTHFLEQVKEKLGVLRLRVSVEGATITIDGRPIAAEDVAHELFLDPGTRTVTAKRAGYIEASATIEAKPGASSEVALTLEPVPREKVQEEAKEGNRSAVPVILLGAVSAAGLGVGIAMTVVSNGKSADAGAQRTAILQGGGQCVKPGSAFVGPCGELNSSLESIDTTANVARVAYVASGLLAIGAITYALLPQPKRASAGWVRAAPMIGASGGGIVVLSLLLSATQLVWLLWKILPSSPQRQKRRAGRRLLCSPRMRWRA